MELGDQDRLLVGAVFLTVLAYVGWVAYHLLAAVA